MITFKEKSSDTKKKFRTVLAIVLGVVSAAYLVLLAFGGLIFGKNSDFYRSINVFSKAGDAIVWLRIISFTFFILICSLVVRLLLKWICTWLDKGKAFMNLLISFVKYIAVIVLIFIILKLLGVDTTTLLAGVGILSLIIGLGAQPLIEDILSGLFIVFEDLFDVGDIIVYDDFRGEVKEIGIRTTRIVDAGGNIKIINNSDMRTFVNMTSQLSLAICDVQIEYGESIERVEAVIAKHIDEIKAAIPDILDGPYYRGVSELGSSGVTLKFLAGCSESTRFQVQRDLNRQIKLLFDANNINIPFTQIVVHEPIEFEKASSKEKEMAAQFVDDQKKKSEELPDSDFASKS